MLSCVCRGLPPVVLLAAPFMLGLSAFIVNLGFHYLFDGK